MFIEIDNASTDIAIECFRIADVHAVLSSATTRESIATTRESVASSYESIANNYESIATTRQRFVSTRQAFAVARISNVTPRIAVVNDYLTIPAANTVFRSPFSIDADSFCQRTLAKNCYFNASAPAQTTAAEKVSIHKTLYKSAFQSIQTAKNPLAHSLLKQMCPEQG